MILLQSFLWIAAATSLPVGALLDERTRAERELNESWAIYETILQNAEDLIILSSLDGGRRFASAAVERLTGWTPEEFIRLDRRTTIHPEDWTMAVLVMNSMRSGKSEHTFRYRLMHKDGSWRWVDASTRVYLDDSGTVKGYVGTVRDITALTATEHAWQSERDTLQQENQKLSALTRTDALTGLLNRRGLESALPAYGGCASVALLLLDVDFFKLFNDTYGHPAGDECLRHIASLLQSVVRGEEVVARIGGEEFALLLPNGTGTDAHHVADRILSRLAEQPLIHRASPFQYVTVSIGISLWHPVAGEEFQQRLQQADQALYKSKKEGRNRHSQMSGVEDTLTLAV